MENEPQEIEPMETKVEEEKQPKGITIHPTEFNANEIAMILGLVKEVKGNEVKYGFTQNGAFSRTVMQLIASHEQFKRERIGLKSAGIIRDPFGK